MEAILVAVLLVAALKLAVLWLEPRMAFFPLRGVDRTPRELGIPYTDVWVRTADGERIHAWHLPREDARAEVVYFHGNGGNLSIWADVLAAVHAEGFAVLAPDYRGYGISSGRPTERGLYRDAEAVVAHFWGDLHRPGVPVVYWGRSLGAVAAAHAASVREPHGLIIESGFPDVGSLLRHYPALLVLSPLASYRFPVVELMRGYAGPTLVLHGDADEIVPFDLGRRLFAALAGTKRFQPVAGGRHNDLPPPRGDPYWRAVDELVALAFEAGRGSSAGTKPAGEER